jgi:hypothetical protein
MIRLTVSYVSGPAGIVWDVFKGLWQALYSVCTFENYDLLLSVVIGRYGTSSRNITSYRLHCMFFLLLQLSLRI